MRRLRLSPIFVALSALAVAASILVAAPTSAQDNDPVLIVDPAASVTFSGSGWGHGVGMSQWAGLARAQDGHSAQEILNFYYENTDLVGNYGYPVVEEPEPEPEPTPTVPTRAQSTTATPASPEDAARVLLATTDTTTLTPEGLNRITVENQNIPVGGNDAARPLAGTPIAFTRGEDGWHISYNGVDICPTGCAGQTAQLHFATDTSVAVSSTGRSYSHGRINLIAVPGNPDRFHITLDSLTVEKFLDDSHNVTAVPATPADSTNTGSGDPADPPEAQIQVVLAAAEAATFAPEGLNRVSIDNQNIPYFGEPVARAPAGTPIVVTRVGGLWRIQFGSTDVCGSGCAGQTAQVHFGTDTSVAVSTTGRSYSHGRINLIAVPGDPNRFHITLDSLTIEKFFGDAHAALPATAGDAVPTTPDPVLDPPTPPRYPEDGIRVHLSTTTATRLTPQGVNRITVDGQGDIRVPAGSSVSVTRHVGHWHFTINGADACGSGCVGHTAQLNFASGTSVAVSNTGHAYSHGRITLVPAGGEPGTFYVILDSLTMEKYLRGIAETPMDWPLAIQEAQAIAARTYASATLRERRASSSWNRPFDLYATVWDQAFVGDTREKHANVALWIQAVEGTAGQILQLNGAPVRAFYSASNGGHTERSGYVFSTDLPHLSAKPDPFDTHAENPYASWTRSYPVATFNRWLNDHPDTAVGHLISMEVLDNVGASGRLDKANIKITGTSRSVTITGNRLQSRVNTAARESGSGQLLSTLFTFSVPAATVVPDADSTTDPGETPPADAVPDEQFYSGVIDSPDFCVNRSLGGPITLAFDSDGDGVADVCSLTRTRREAVAHQRALEELAAFKREIFYRRFAEECRSVAESFGNPEKEAIDECQQYRDPTGNAPAGSGAVPAANGGDGAPDSGGHEDQYTVEDQQYFSGIITGPDFCLNHSLGGPATYAFDSDGDGVADVCVLPRTRREAVARQRALEHLPQATSELEGLYQAFFFSNCIEGPATLGEPEDEAEDMCEPHIRLGPV